MSAWEFTGGLPETRCGRGSMMAYTANVRKRLPDLLRQYDVRSLIDAPCGDGNWISHIPMDGIAYIGIDIDQDSVALSVKRQWTEPPSSRCYLIGDILTARLPFSDALMCRDFLQHLPNELARVALYKFKMSGKWLLATSHSNEANEDLGPDNFRPLNLQAAPFALPQPDAAIADGDGRILGMWHCSQL